MYALNIPNRDHAADYDECITYRRLRRTRDLLTAANGGAKVAYLDYLGASGDAASLQPLAATKPLQRAWRGNYALLSKNGPMATMRGDLMATATHGLCPLCGRGGAATLDHYLPKTRFPEFSAFGGNLIPACDGCNRLKGTKCGTTPASQFLQPYFHRLPEEEILHASITIGTTVMVEFGVQHSPSLQPELFQRIQYQFEILELKKHFLREASLELADRRHSLQQEFGAGADAVAVAEYLHREAESVRRSRGLNNWKTALLLGLTRSHSFCSGGFALP